MMEIAAVVAILVLLIGIPVVVVNRDLLFHRSAAKRPPEDAQLPFLIIPSSLGASDLVPSGVVRRNPATQSGAAAKMGSPPVAPSEPASSERWAEPVEKEDYSDESMELDESEQRSPNETVVFNRPVDEPMQILPGRLQVISGEPATDDLRLFSRLGEPARIVVGRATGPPHRHITLHSPTVSRRHARMDFDNGVWTITNLSQTNPVLVNDRVLANGGSARKLSDGDRIELGEVALRFLSS